VFIKKNPPMTKSNDLDLSNDVWCAQEMIRKLIHAIVEVGRLDLLYGDRRGGGFSLWPRWWHAAEILALAAGLSRQNLGIFYSISCQKLETALESRGQKISR
jgi:hypothetical protein